MYKYEYTHEPVTPLGEYKKITLSFAQDRVNNEIDDYWYETERLINYGD